MEIEVWADSKLVARHACSDELTADEILKRFGINRRYTVRIHPAGRPDQVRTIQREISEKDA